VHSTETAFSEAKYCFWDSFADKHYYFYLPPLGASFLTCAFFLNLYEIRKNPAYENERFFFVFISFGHQKFYITFAFRNFIYAFRNAENIKVRAVSLSLKVEI
jgi:hypothetical protein